MILEGETTGRDEVRRAGTFPNTIVLYNFSIILWDYTPAKDPLKSVLNTMYENAPRIYDSLTCKIAQVLYLHQTLTQY